MLLLLSTALCAILVQSAHKDRVEQLRRMKQYTTDHLVPQMVSESTMLLSFDAFDQHYEVQLTRETHKTPANVRHRNVGHEVHSPLSAQKESCHWQGTVVNFDGPSVVSASFCEGRGIRARISAFNEILIIKPSAYYLDLAKDALANHSVEDEVLMYRVSDFEHPEITGTEGVTIAADDVLMSEGENMRRRLYTASSPGETEVTVMIGPVRTANYQSDHGDDWYTQLYGDTADMMNAVDAIYAAANFNANGRDSVGPAGGLRVRFSEIHVIYAFTGTYASLAPTKRYSNCALASNEYDDSDLCAVYGDDWLGLIYTWVSTNMDTSDYDNVQFITDIKFEWYSCGSYVCSRVLGWGNIGVVCRGAVSVSVNSVVQDMGGMDTAVGTIAHELGHNFGLYHDGQSGPASSCGEDDGLMGYGDNSDTFSTCSLDSMEDYYQGNGGGLACLGVGWDDDDVVSNVAGSTPVSPVTPAPVTSPVATPSPVSNPVATPSPVSAPVATPSPVSTPVATPSPVTSSSSGCINIEIGFDELDGTWDEIDGGYNGQSAYRIENYDGYERFLFYDGTTWYGHELNWIISDSLGSTSVYMYCPQSSVWNCGGVWREITGSYSYTYYPSSVTDDDCVPTGTTDMSCASYTCLYVAGTSDYDGYYTASNDCNDGHRVFQGDSDSKVLCYDDWYSRWIFTDNTCDLGGALSASTTGDVLSPSYWLLNTGGNSYRSSSDVYVSDCGNSAPFTGLDCLEDNAYDENICVTTNTTLWDSERTFSVYEQECANDKPIYHFIVYNESKTVQIGDQTLTEEIEATFYLHYQPEYLFSTDEEMTGQWMVTKDEISVNYVALCQQEDLMDCIGNQWKIKMTEYSPEDALNGIILEVLDEHMTVSDGACDAMEYQQDDGTSTTSILVIIVAVLLVVVLCIAGFFIWKRMNQDDALRIKQAVSMNSAHTVPTGTGAEEAEPEVEVEVTMAANTSHTVM